MMREREADLDAGDATLDVLLDERLAGEAPPDLVAAIGVRHRRGDGARAAAVCAATEAPRVRRHRWLVAAFVLLGVGVVVATQWSTRREPERPATAPTAPQDPAPPARDPALRGTVSLRVEDRNGGPVQHCTLTVLAVLNADAQRYGRLPDHPERTLHPRDFVDGSVSVELGPGLFVARIAEDQHAPTFSAPFAVEPGKPTPPVVVRLVAGGELSGVVRDADGKPLAGAVVSTQSDLVTQGGAPRALAELLEKQVYPVHTTWKLRTNANGAFQMRRLTHGKYALRIEHDAFCPLVVPGLNVDGKPIALAVWQLERGAIVAGIARVAGKPAAGVRVTVSRVDGSPHPPSWQAISGEDGAYRFGERLPPGKYSIAGWTGDPKENAFGKILQLRDSTREFAIAAGEDRAAQDVTIAK